MTAIQEVAALARLQEMTAALRTLNALVADATHKIEAARVRMPVTSDTYDAEERDLLCSLHDAQLNVSSFSARMGGIIARAQKGGK